MLWASDAVSSSDDRGTDHAAWSAGSELQRLDLSDNPMTEEVAPALAEALRQQSGLVRLNLNDTSLQDEGISAIAEVPRTPSPVYYRTSGYLAPPVLDMMLLPPVCLRSQGLAAAVLHRSTS